MKLRVFDLIAIMVFSAAPAWGAQFTQRGASGDEQKMDVTADKLSTSDGGMKIEASGNVEIKRQETTLKADEVRFDRETQDVEAKGRVSVDDPEWKVKSADAVQMNMEKEIGEIQNGDLFIEQGRVSIMGRRFQKFAGQTYHVDDGFFTTCLCDSGAPSWKFSAEQMDLTLDGLGIIKNGYFYIYDVPVFYLPYGFFPLRTERQSGFLFPKIGQSSKEGFRFHQPFFWAISKSTDATLAFDVASRARVGLLGEFRTIFNRESNFQLDSAYFNEAWRKNADQDIVNRTIADQNIPKNRWSNIGTHRYTTAADWLTYSDFTAFSDDLFARELIGRFDLPLSTEGNLRVSRYGASRFGVFKNWGDTYFKTGWSLYQDFIQFDKQTLQSTPQIAFWGRRLLADFPLEFRWQATGVNYLRRAQGGAVLEGGGGDGLRLDLRPELVLPFNVASYLFGSLSVAPRETAYHLYQSAQPGEHNISRELVEIRGNIGTSLNRVFAGGGLGAEGLKHVIEPTLSYLFIPGTNQNSIPNMDKIDHINRRNVFTLAVANRLWGKFANPLASASADKDVELLNPTVPAYQQLGSLGLALSYNIDQARKGEHAWSDIDTNLRITPTNYINLRFDGGLGTGPWQVTQANATFSINDPRIISRRVLDPDFLRPNSFSLSVQYVRSGPNGYLSEDANVNLDAPPNCVLHDSDPRCPGTGFKKSSIVGNLGANMFYHLTDNLLFSLNSTYNVRDSQFIGVAGALKFLSFCECWTATFSLGHSINPDKTSFNFDFNLLGLGSQKNTLR